MAGVEEAKTMKPPCEWLAERYPGMQIIDPDGWDRANLEEDWARELTLEEFLDRFFVSTVGPKGAGFFDLCEGT